MCKAGKMIFIIGVLGGLCILMGSVVYGWDPAGRKAVIINEKTGAVSGKVAIEKILKKDSEGVWICIGMKVLYLNSEGKTYTERVMLQDLYLNDAWFRGSRVYIDYSGGGKENLIIVNSKKGVIEYKGKRKQEHPVQDVREMSKERNFREEGDKWYIIDATGQEKKLVLPTISKGKKIIPWPLEEVGGGLYVLCWLGEESCEHGKGMLAIVDGNTGIVRSVCADNLESFFSKGFGRFYKPQVTITDKLILVQEKDSIRAVERSTGKPRWTSIGITLGQADYRRGGWLTGNRLYLYTFSGKETECGEAVPGTVTSLDANTGKVIWRCKEPFLAMKKFHIGSDGYLYVESWEEDID